MRPKLVGVEHWGLKELRTSCPEYVRHICSFLHWVRVKQFEQIINQRMVGTRFEINELWSEPRAFL